MKSLADIKKEEQKLYERIRKHYKKKLKRYIPDDEVKEIADNLLNFAKAIHGIKS